MELIIAILSVIVIFGVIISEPQTEASNAFGGSKPNLFSVNKKERGFESILAKVIAFAGGGILLFSILLRVF